jgi:hypothetical protein
MDNISCCLGGTSQAAQFSANFTPQDIAPYILPKLHQLVSGRPPTDIVWRFTEDVVCNTSLAKALALHGECPRLAQYLIESNEFVSRLAVSCLRRMIGMETAVIRAAYEALAVAAPHIPFVDLPDGTAHPAVKFFVEVAPKIIEDCFRNGLWTTISRSSHMESIPFDRLSCRRSY